jgi:hypothetical protein
MTLGHDVTWEEATSEFHNFLRAAGYVISYDFEKEEEQDEDDFEEPLIDGYPLHSGLPNRKHQADLRIGAWLSAALEDPSTCQSMKDDINEWFECTPEMHRNTTQNQQEINQ